MDKEVQQLVLSKLSHNCDCTHINTLFSQPRENGMRSSSNCTILTFQNNANRTSITMINGESETRKQRYHDTGSPRSLFLMSAKDTTNESVANLVLYFNIVDNGASRKCQYICEQD